MEPDWPTIGRVIRQRREELGLTQGAGAVSVATWRKIEKGIDPPYRRSTLIAIARALRWPDDAIDQIRAGRLPDEQLAERDDRILEERLEQLEIVLKKLREELCARQRRPRPARLGRR